MPRILLIQADDTRRQLDASVLRGAGHEVHEIAQGRSGVSLARRLRPDAVVCDIQLPEFTGLDVVTALRQGVMAARTPFLMLLPRPDNTLVLQAIAAGADECLAMPITPQELVDAIERLFTPAVMAGASDSRRSEPSSRGRSSGPRSSGGASSVSPRSGSGSSNSVSLTEAEQALAEQINREWAARERATSLEPLGYATFLLANLFSDRNLAARGDPINPDLVMRRLTQAMDSLKLFGASHVLPFGTDLMAIFPQQPRNRSHRDRLRAVRAAFGLLHAIDALNASAQSAQPGARLETALPADLAEPGLMQPLRPLGLGGESTLTDRSGASTALIEAPGMPARPHDISVALHCGDLHLARLHDPIHGEMPQWMPLGSPLSEAIRLREQAARKGWRLAASEAAVRGIDRALTLGRTSTAVSDHGEHNSYEVLGLR